MKPVAVTSLSKKLLEGEEDLWDRVVSAAEQSQDEDIDAIVEFIAQVLNGGVEQFVNNCMSDGNDDAWMLAITFLQRVKANPGGQYDEREVHACTQLLYHMRHISADVEDLKTRNSDDDSYADTSKFDALEGFLYSSENSTLIYNAILRAAGIEMAGSSPAAPAQGEGGRGHWGGNSGNIY